MGRNITDYLLYRWRYILGYSLIGLAVVGLLLLAGLAIPGGLSQDEMDSAVRSSALSIKSFEPAFIVNLPYHLLQRLSIELFGMTNFSIKLPSLILGALSAVGMIMLLRTWFRQNVAVIATIVAITTGQFLYIAQSGTPGIMYVFWSIWLLVAAMMVSRHARREVLWKILLFGVAALSLYTPLSIYILAALMSAMVLHPHLRYIVRKLSKVKLLAASIGALIPVALLAYTIVQQPSIGLTLLGVPGEWPNVWANISQLFKQYFDFATPSNGMPMLPVYGLGTMILVAIGIFHVITTKYTARSYVISAWVLMLVPILVINPGLTSVTFVPTLLLLAMGVHSLLRSWYRLFPRNPYARIAGLIPVAVLIGGIVLSGVNRYTYGYLYNPETAGKFSKDLRIIDKQLADPDRGDTVIVVAGDEVEFYTAVAKHHDNVSLSPAITAQVDTSIVSHKANHTLKPGATPTHIATDGSKYNADRFYVYKTSTER